MIILLGVMWRSRSTIELKVWDQGKIWGEKFISSSIYYRIESGVFHPAHPHKLVRLSIYYRIESF